MACALPRCPSLASRGAVESLAAARRWPPTPIPIAVCSPSREPRTRAVLGGVLAIARITEVSTLRVHAARHVSRYSGEDALDSDDWGFITVYRRNGERFGFECAGRSRRRQHAGHRARGNRFRRRQHAPPLDAGVDVAFTQYVGVRHLLQYHLAGATSTTIARPERASSAIAIRRWTHVLREMSPRLEVTVTHNSARLEVRPRTSKATTAARSPAFVSRFPKISISKPAWAGYETTRTAGPRAELLCGCLLAQRTSDAGPVVATSSRAAMASWLCG